MVDQSGQFVKVQAVFDDQSVVIDDQSCPTGLSGGGFGQTVLHVPNATTVTTTPCPTATITSTTTETVTITSTTTTTTTSSTTTSTTTSTTITSTSTTLLTTSTTTIPPCACMELCCEAPHDVVGVDASRLDQNECPPWWDSSPIDHLAGAASGPQSFVDVAAPAGRSPFPPPSIAPLVATPPPQAPAAVITGLDDADAADAEADRLEGGFQGGLASKVPWLLGLFAGVVVVGGLATGWLPRRRRRQSYARLPAHGGNGEDRAAAFLQADSPSASEEEEEELDEEEALLLQPRTAAYEPIIAGGA